MDEFGQEWSADIARKDNGSWGSVSWADDFEDVNPYQEANVIPQIR